MPITAATPRSPATAAACAKSGHPLEMFPVFRRVPRSFARDLVYTLIWNALFAAVFTALNMLIVPAEPLADLLWSTFVFANCIGFIIHFEFAIGDRLYPGVYKHGTAIRAAYVSLLAVAGVFAGYWLATEILHYHVMQGWIFSPRGIFSIGGMALLISTLLLMIFIPRERAARMEAAFERERSRVAAAERETTLARYKLLEAQVEPHFLYNTLANVVSLVDSNPATAKKMLERLIALLRGAAAAAGATEATLSTQVEHLRAFLELMALRMGGRLAFRIDVEPGLAELRLPPLLLQPLVENAIKHGLEPKVEGGEVVVVARRAGQFIDFTVADSGVGFQHVRVRSGAEGGVGLPNLRARLAALHGDAASVTVEENVPCGTRVTMHLPVNETRAAYAA